MSALTSTSWGCTPNRNAGDPSKWTYDKEPGVRAVEATAKQVLATRLTGQLTPRHKVGFYYDYQFTCNGLALVEDAGVCRSRGSDWIGMGTATAAPEASPGANNNGYLDSYQRMTQASWTAPMSSNLLFDAAYSGFFNRYGPQIPPGSVLELNEVTEQRSLQNSDGTFAPANLTYRAQDAHGSNYLFNQNWRASASYVTGTHEMKFGYQGVRYAWGRTFQYNNTRVNYTFNNTLPVSLLMNIGSWQVTTITGWNALYAQDQWRMGRLSLQGAVVMTARRAMRRPRATAGTVPIVFMRNRSRSPCTPGVDAYHDITPRFSGAFDLFGTGKTALKANAGKILRAAANDPPYIATNPALNFQRTTARAWNDVNGNYVSDCDLMNPALNGECGPWLSPAFGNRIVPVTINPGSPGGWGVREYDWKVGSRSSTSCSRYICARWSTTGAGSATSWCSITVPFAPRISIALPSMLQRTSNYLGRWYPLTYVDPRVLTQDHYLTFETDYAPQRTDRTGTGSPPASTCVHAAVWRFKVVSILGEASGTTARLSPRYPS